MNAKSVNFVRESLMRIDSECEKPVSWFKLTGGATPDKWDKGRYRRELIDCCLAFERIQALAQQAILETQLRRGGVFPVGQSQGELEVDSARPVG